MMAGPPAEVGVGGRHVAQALLIPLMVVVLNEGLDLRLKVARHPSIINVSAPT